MGSVQNGGTINCYKAPGLLESQPPVIIRGCLSFFGGNRIVRRFGRCSYVLLFIMANCIFLGTHMFMLTLCTSRPEHRLRVNALA